MAVPVGGRASPRRPGLGPTGRVATFAGTTLVILALSVLPLLAPTFVHPALDAAAAADRLGMSAAEAHRMSDLSVGELLAGPGTFAFAGPDGQPFYDAAERGHLGDARLLLWLCLAAGAISALGLGMALARSARDRRRRLWHVISRAGASAAVAVVILAAVSLFAFDALFRLFHEVFFPGGNWAFDPNTDRLVQLYPFDFWQLAAAALGLLVVLWGVAAWWLGRRLGRRPAMTVSGPADPAAALPRQEV